MKDRVSNALLFVSIGCTFSLCIILGREVDAVKKQQAMFRDKITTIATNQLDMAENQHRIISQMNDMVSTELFTLTNLSWVVQKIK